MTLRIAVAVMALALGTLAAAAQDATPTPVPEPAGALTFQLNKAETRDGNCQLTFVVQNDTGTVIEKSVYNIAIVDTDGAVSQLVNIEFRPLPVGRLKAQSFGITGITCENISAMSINEFSECTAEGGAASTLCESAIVETSRPGMSIQFPWTL
jgi:hypothetical protein